MKRQLPLLLGAFTLALLLGLGLRGLAGRLGSPGQPAPDSAPPAPGLAFEGIVHVVGAGAPALWVVGDYPVTVISTTAVITNGLPARPGIWARVEAIKRDALQATTVELQPAPTSDLYDRIWSIDADHGLWQVGSTPVRVGPQTVIIGSAPAVDHWAQVHGTLSDQGINASRIVVVSADTEAIYQGTLQAMNGADWQIDHVIVEIGPTTVFSGAAPAVGSQVQARGAEVGPGRLAAAHIWTLEDASPAVRFMGWLQRIDGQAFPFLWRVNLIDGPQLRPVFLAVYSDTLIDESAGPATPGAWLTGGAIYQGNSIYRAHSIAVLPRAPKNQFVGQIVSLPPSGLVGIWQVGQYRIEVTPDTGVVGLPHVGAMVWVSGTPDYANVIQAQLIEVLGE